MAERRQKKAGQCPALLFPLPRKPETQPYDKDGGDSCPVDHQFLCHVAAVSCLVVHMTRVPLHTCGKMAI